MLAPIEFERLQSALTTPAGAIELVVIAMSFAIGLTVDRHVRLRTEAREGVARAGLGSINRLILPLVTLALLGIAWRAFRHYQPPFFLAIVLPLVIALAAIRLTVYAFRGVAAADAIVSGRERAISWTIWGAVLLYFTGVLPLVAAELDAMVLPIGKSSVSLLEIIKGAMAILATLVVALTIAGLVERRLMHASAIDGNVRVVTSKLMRAVLLTLAVLFALQWVGIDLTLLTVLGGALGVGIGFGLQKLASNYIAGYTILLDRSIRMGDMITVDNRQGFVSRLAARYVVVRSQDGVEAIVPNEILVTSTVLNHSYSSPEIRLAVVVPVAYDSDVERALAIMVELARREPRVLREPRNAPAAFVSRFGDTAIELELGIWIADPENGQQNLRSDLSRAILAAFRTAGVRIPLPQREVGGGSVYGRSW